MSIACSLRGHQRAALVIRNGGHSFSNCCRCGSDIVERSGRWRTAPAGFRIVWKLASPEQTLSQVPEAEPPAASPADATYQANRRRENDRRRQGLRQSFAGPERRFRNRERRTSNVAEPVLFERDNVRITRATAKFGAATYPLETLRDVDVVSETGELSLVYLLYAMLAALAALQAHLENELSMWPISGALLVLAHVAWRRRRPAPEFSVVLSSAAGEAIVHRAATLSEAGLLRDAVLMGMPRLRAAS